MRKSSKSGLAEPEATRWALDHRARSGRSVELLLCAQRSGRRGFGVEGCHQPRCHEKDIRGDAPEPHRSGDGHVFPMGQSTAYRSGI